MAQQYRDFQPLCGQENVCLVHMMRLGVFLRLIPAVCIFLLVLGFLTRHLYCLQVGRHTEFSRKSEVLYTYRKDMPSYRGRIMDCNGNILAVDQPAMDFYAEPGRFADRQNEVVACLSDKLGLSPSELRERLQKGIRRELSFTVVSDLTPDRAQELEKYCTKSLVLQGKKDGMQRLQYFPGRDNEEQRQEMVSRLSKVLAIDAKELDNSVKKTLGRFAEIPLQWKVPLEEGREAVELLNTLKIKGIRTVDTNRRLYPRGAMMSNMLGLLDVNGRGVSGIEGLLNDYLTPQDGSVKFLRDRYGHSFDVGEIVVKPPQNGADVYLTIEEPLQLIVEEELAKMTAERKPAHAYAVMINPATGAIMALAQYPSFNPNERDSLLDPGLTSNHILVQCYDPGSIMKALTIGGAMERHFVNLNTVFDCEHGSMYYGGKTIHDDKHHYDDLTIAEILQKSSNIGTAKVALLMGDATTYDCLNSFQFGRLTGLGFYPENQPKRVFGSESPGSFRALRNWDKLTGTRVAFGQGIRTSILQIVQAWSTLANDGIMMQPYLIDRIVMPDGQVISSKPRMKGRPLSAETVESIREALVMVTQKGGTGTKAAVPGYEVAGKTGTGQQWISEDKEHGIRGHYSDKYCLASFVGFVPAKNPRFLLIVSAEGAQGYPRSGGYVSAPVFQKIASRSLEYLQIPPDNEEEYLAAKEKEERAFAQQQLEEQRRQKRATTSRSQNNPSVSTR